MATLHDIKVQAAVDAMIENGLNQSVAAKQLGISRGGLRSLLSQFTGTKKDINKKILMSLYYPL